METDMIGKYVRRMLAPLTGRDKRPDRTKSAALDMDFLARNGFFIAGLSGLRYITAFGEYGHDSAKTIEGKLNASNLGIAVVAARFNDFIVDRLLGGALDYLFAPWP